MNGFFGWLKLWLHCLTRLSFLSVKSPHGMCWVRNTIHDRVRNTFSVTTKYHYCSCGYGTEYLPPAFRRTVKEFDHKMILRDPVL